MSDLKLQLIIEALNKTDKAFAELREDLKRATGNIDQMSARSERAGKAMGGHMHHATQKVGLFRSSIMNASMQLMMLEMVVQQIARGLDALVFRFNSTLETATLGIATAFVSGGQYIDETTGKALEGQAALAAAQTDSRRILEELQVANFQTIATLDQLVRAYQETLPVAMARGFDRHQVKEYTVAMVQAAGAIGLSLDQLAEETRSILTGAINPRTSRIATVLGLTNEDVRQHSENADQLFRFLMDKLDAYKIAGIESQKTWAGVWSNTLDLFNQISAKVSEPLFETVKTELQDIADSIVTIDDKTGQIQWDKDFLEGMESLKEGVTNVIAEFYRLGMLVDKVGGTLTALGALVTFGDWDEKFREWNAMYERRYNESERKLQELASRAAGLDSDGNFRKDRAAGYRQRPGADETDEETAKTYDKLTRKIQSARSSLLQKETKALESDLEGAADAFRGFAGQLELTGGAMAEITSGLTLYQEGADAAGSAVEKLGEKTGGVFDEMSNAVQGWASDFSAQLTDVFWGADLTFSKILESFGRMLTRMVIQKQIVEPLLGAGLDFLGGLFSADPTPAAASGGFAPSIDYGAFSIRKHDGGPVVPRFHFGGLLPDEVPTILQTGERVLSREQNKIFERLAANMNGGTTVHQSIQVDARGADAGVEARVRQAAEEGARRGYELVLQDIRGRGQIRKALG